VVSDANWSVRKAPQLDADGGPPYLLDELVVNAVEAFCNVSIQHNILFMETRFPFWM